MVLGWALGLEYQFRLAVLGQDYAATPTARGAGRDQSQGYPARVEQEANADHRDRQACHQICRH